MTIVSSHIVVECQGVWLSDSLDADAGDFEFERRSVIRSLHLQLDELYLISSKLGIVWMYLEKESVSSETVLEFLYCVFWHGV